MKKALVSFLLLATSLSLIPVSWADGDASLLRASQTSSYTNSTAPSVPYVTRTVTTTTREERGASGEPIGGAASLMPLRGRVSTIPRGAIMMIRLNGPVSTNASSLGESISATLENDVYANDEVVVPANSEVIGQVTMVDKAGRLGKSGQIEIRFIGIKLSDGSLVPIRAHVVTKDDTGVLHGDSYKMQIAKDAGIVVGSAGLGTGMGVAAGSLIGNVAGGALFGLAGGGLAGATYMLMRQGKEVTIPSGSRMSIVMEQSASVNN